MYRILECAIGMVDTVKQTYSYKNKKRRVIDVAINSASVRQLLLLPCNRHPIVRTPEVTGPSNRESTVKASLH